MLFIRFISKLIRLAIPRRVCTNNYIDYIYASLKNIFNKYNNVYSGFKIIWKTTILKHFTIELERE